MPSPDPAPSPALASPDTPGAAGPPTRQARLRAVVEECLKRRAAGEALTDQQVLAAHADLLPELERELGLLRLIERARSASRPAPNRPSRLGDAIAPARGAAAPAEGPGRAPAPALPDWVEGYHFIREVHRGGQGVVYEAMQRSTGRRVAVKVRRENFFADRRDEERFHREVEILAQLQHPGIVGVIDSGVRDGRLYCVMDFIDGLPVDAYLAANPLNVRDILRLFEKIALAVNAAHLRGVIHRDLKPANILVDATGEPHLLDFGLARLMAQLGQPAREGQTIEGQFVGSLPWASPEQAQGRPEQIDLRTDVYSLGVILFNMLTGRMPYDVLSGSRDLRTALDAILAAEPRRPSGVRRGVDPDVDTIVLKCLSKERQRRYQSAGDLAEDVRRHLESRPIRAHPPSAAYHLRRFARRHRVLAIAAGAVAAALTVGAASTLLQLARAQRAERLAESRRVEAERQSYIANIAAADAALSLGDGGTAGIRLAAAPADLRRWEWRYLDNLCDQSSLRVDLGGRVHGAAVPGTGLVVAASDQGVVAGIDQWTGQVRWRREGPRTLFVCAGAGQACLLTRSDAVLIDPATGDERLRVRLIDQPFRVDGGCLIGEGPMLAFSLASGLGMRVMDLRTRRIVYLTNKCDICRTADPAATADGSLLALFDDTDLVVLRTADWKEQWRCPVRIRGGSEHGAVAFSPDGRSLAASIDGRAEVFDALSGRRTVTVPGHRQPILAMALDRSGTRLFTAAADKSVGAWAGPPDTGAEQRWTGLMLRGHSGLPLSLGLTDDGAGLWTFGGDGTARRWELARAREPAVAVASVADAPMRCWAGADGLARASLGKEFITVDPRTASAIGPVLRPPVGIVGIADRSGLRAYGMLNSSTLRAVDLVDLTRVWDAPINAGLSWCMDLSPDATLLATTDRDSSVRLWSTADGSTLATMRGHTKPVRAVRFSRDGRLIASCGGDGEVRLWSVQDRSARLTITNQPGGRNTPVVDCDPGPDGRDVAFGDETGRVTLADGLTGRVRWQGPPLGGETFAVRLHPDGSRVATGGRDGLVRIWDTRTGDELLQLRGHTAGVTDVAWSADGDTLISGGLDHTLRVWSGARRAQPGQPVK